MQVPGHKGISGVEIANMLARKNSAPIFTGLEAVVAITKTVIRNVVAEWIIKIHHVQEHNIEGHVHSKRMMSSFSSRCDGAQPSSTA